MKNTAIFLLTVIGVTASALTQRSFAQEQAQNVPQATQPVKTFSRWSLEILAGPAFPVGQYANGNGIPGFGPIHSGGVAEISGTYHLNHSFGIVLLAGGQLNRGNGIPYSPVPAPQNSGTPGDQAYNSKYWKIARFMTGGEYTFPLNKKQGVSLLVRLLAGVQKTKPADYNFYFPNSGSRLSYTSVDLPWSFSYQMDAGLKWQAKKRVALIAYAGYNGSKSSKDFTYALETFAPPSEIITEKGTFPAGSLLFRAGIYFFP